MEPICGVPKILQKRINFPTFVGGGGGKKGKELFPPYELFFLKASLNYDIVDCPLVRVLTLVHLAAHLS